VLRNDLQRVGCAEPRNTGSLSTVVQCLEVQALPTSKNPNIEKPITTKNPAMVNTMTGDWSQLPKSMPVNRPAAWGAE